MIQNNPIIQNNLSILTVGDGDLSLSLSIINQFPQSKLIATTYDSLQQLQQKYDPFINHTIKCLQKKQVQLFHQIDAVKIDQIFQNKKFDRIIWNFPHGGFPDVPKGPGFEYEEEWQIKHTSSIQGFLSASKSLLNEQGEIIITNKNIKPFSDWGLENMAQLLNLQLKQKIKFDFSWFPGYENRRGDGKNPARRFPADDAITFIFQINKQQ